LWLFLLFKKIKKGPEEPSPEVVEKPAEEVA
jgi:hypothetical protein